MTQPDVTPDYQPPVPTDAPAPTKKPAAPMGALVWLSLIPVVLIVLLWLYSGWKEYGHDWRRGEQGTTVKSDLGNVQVIRWTRTGPANPMAGETVKKQWNVAGLANKQSASNDGNSTKNSTTIPYWMLLIVVSLLPIQTVARAQRRAKRRADLAASTAAF